MNDAYEQNPMHHSTLRWLFIYAECLVTVEIRKLIITICFLKNNVWQLKYKRLYLRNGSLTYAAWLLRYIRLFLQTHTHDDNLITAFIHVPVKTGFTKSIQEQHIISTAAA